MPACLRPENKKLAVSGIVDISIVPYNRAIWLCEPDIGSVVLDLADEVELKKQTPWGWLEICVMGNKGYARRMLDKR